MVSATLVLLALLVASGERKELRAGAGARVDLKRIEQQVSEGKLSLHPGEFYRKLKSPEEAE